jgi:hypothetical protein
VDSFGIVERGFGPNIANEHKAFSCLDDTIAEIGWLVWCDEGAEVFELNFVCFAVDGYFFAIAIPAWVVEVGEEAVAVLFRLSVISQRL